MSDILASIISYIADNPLQIAGTLIGILYLIQEIKASKWMWLTSIIMPLISVFVYSRAGLYADFGINVYYVVIAVYGFCAWKWGGVSKKKQDGERGASSGGGELPVSRTPLKMWPVLAAASAAVFCLIYWVLTSFTDSTVPAADSFTTALSIVGMVMLSRKWIEQWGVWAVVDVASTCLYVYKGIYGYAVLYAVYTVLAFYGYARWAGQMTKDNDKERME